jgi:ribosome-associated heat shock protein Hsp15
MKGGRNTEQGVRIDKWLWAARLFKTRTLAADACGIGRVECNGTRAKASRDVNAGDMLRVTNEAGVFYIEVLGVTEARGSAAVAQELYRETAESREQRLKAAEERKQMLEIGAIPMGKPSRRDRHQLDRLRGRIHRFGAD